MRTSQRKAKGRGFVLEVKAWLHSVFPWTVDHDIIVPATSAPGEDLVFSPQMQAVFPYSLEMKRQEGFANIYAAYDQSAKNTRPGLRPIVILRSNHRPALVTMSLETFREIINENHQV